VIILNRFSSENSTIRPGAGGGEQPGPSWSSEAQPLEALRPEGRQGSRSAGRELRTRAGRRHNEPHGVGAQPDGVHADRVVGPTALPTALTAGNDLALSKTLG
jgi:hypothetical protein